MAVMAGSLLPFLVKAGSAAKLPLLLRTAGVLGGAAPSLMRGDLGGAIVGGGIGGLSTLGLGGPLRGFSQAAKGAIKGQMLPQALGQSLRVGAGIGIPAVAGLGIGRLAGGVGKGPADTVGKGALGLAGYGLTGGEGLGGSALPPGTGGFGFINPQGSPLDVLNPVGLDAGRRTRTVKDAEALRDAQNIILPTVRKFAEQAKKDEFARSMAGESIRQNIMTNAALTQNAQAAILNMGQNTANAAANALTSRLTY
tara:strand:+ start:381 stop:1142 length:762 start_codon:yes stop_codon:yes gene_type:complete